MRLSPKKIQQINEDLEGAAPYQIASFLKTLIELTEINDLNEFVRHEDFLRQILKLEPKDIKSLTKTIQKQEPHLIKDLISILEKDQRSGIQEMLHQDRIILERIQTQLGEYLLNSHER